MMVEEKLIFGLKCHVRRTCLVRELHEAQGWSRSAWTVLSSIWAKPRAAVLTVNESHRKYQIHLEESMDKQIIAC